MSRDPHVEADSPAGSRNSRFARLTSTDLMFLRLESAEWPAHFGGLAVLEEAALQDRTGRLRLREIRDQLDRRVAHVPALRQRIYTPGLLRGRPLWVDDRRFDIRDHVHESAVRSPGGDTELLEAAADVYGGLLDRSRPLWELWFLTGLSEGRIGVLLKLHHAVADGLAAVAVMASLFDFDPDTPDPARVPRTPEPLPGRWSLVADNFSSKMHSVRRALAAVIHPVRLANGVRTFAHVARRSFGTPAAPIGSLNEPVQAGRRVRSLRLDLTTMKEIAHAHEGKVNDVVLDLWSGGLRRLLVSRGEPVAGVELLTGLAVSLRSPTGAGTVDNQVGTMVLPLPVSEADPRRRLETIVTTTRRVKSEQRPAKILGFLAAVAATPIGRSFATRQRSTNVLVTNVIGPPVPMYLLGARILDVLPIIQLMGNIGLTLCAFSYAGRISLVVTADATAFPDLDELITGMERDWHELAPGPLEP